MDRDGTIVPPGEELMPGLTTDELRYVEYVESPEGPAMLLRPVEEYPCQTSLMLPSQDSVVMLAAIKVCGPCSAFLLRMAIASSQLKGKNCCGLN
jgi:hypothetical protein